MKEAPPPHRGRPAILPWLLATIFFAVCVACPGCYANNGRLEEEFSKGYAAGEAAVEARLLGNQESLAGEEAQGVLAAIGEGTAARFELSGYSIEGNTCRAYGTMVLSDGGTLYVSLFLEKEDGVWRVTELGQGSPGEGG